MSVSTYSSEVLKIPSVFYRGFDWHRGKIVLIILNVSAGSTLLASYKLIGHALQNARSLSKLRKWVFVVYFLKSQINPDQKGRCFLGK
jgi:hypothetical protein